jgi:hypothetical protein
MLESPSSFIHSLSRAPPIISEKAPFVPEGPKIADTCCSRHYISPSKYVRIILGCLHCKNTYRELVNVYNCINTKQLLIGFLQELYIGFLHVFELAFCRQLSARRSYLAATEAGIEIAHNQNNKLISHFPVFSNDG